MPPDFVEEVFRAHIAKLKGPTGVTDKGFGAPLNIFLFQELQRLQNIIAIVRNNLSSLIMAIDGTVVMTPELLQDLNNVFDAKVPGRWTHDPSGAEISWLMPNIGGWFTGLLDRQILLNTWLENGRNHMKAYWLTGFTNAQGIKSYLDIFVKIERNLCLFDRERFGIALDIFLDGCPVRERHWLVPSCVVPFRSIVYYIASWTQCTRTGVFADIICKSLCISITILEVF